MARLREIPESEMDEAQRAAVAEAVSGVRGRIPAPMRAWIASPELASRAQKLGEFLRYGTALGPRLSELAILVTARAWTSQYEWFIHEKAAREAGLDERIIEAVAARRTPSFSDEKERVVYEVALTLHAERRLPDALYDEAKHLLGERPLAELIGVLGYYTLVSMTLNVFEIGVPAETPDPLAP
ncbi:carboxymuconolactone decarboxylase family protein [Acetobacteraceae bacterium H6797]|nr:carboxymuconolactone decarboxylase family protein [Acetobacteraceae bacterium H6797]